MFNVALAQEAAQQTPPAAGGGMNSILGFLPIILIFVVLYFLMILPQQRRQKKHTEMIKALKRGDRVILSAGFHGIITTVRENTFLVKIGENVEVETDKSAVSVKLGGDNK